MVTVTATATATGFDYGYGEVDGEHAGWVGRGRGGSPSLARRHPLRCVPPCRCMAYAGHMHMCTSAASRAVWTAARSNEARCASLPAHSRFASTCASSSATRALSASSLLADVRRAAACAASRWLASTCKVEGYDWIRVQVLDSCPLTLTALVASTCTSLRERARSSVFRWTNALLLWTRPFSPLDQSVSS